MTTGTANERLLDATIRHQVQVLRLGKGEAKRAASFLAATEGDLVAKIAAASSGSRTQKSLESLLVDIRSMRKEAIATMGGELGKSTKGLVNTEIEWEQAAMQGSLPVDLRLASVTPHAVRAVARSPIRGIPIEGWLNGMEKGDISRLEQAVRLGFLEGETVDQITRRIRGTAANRFKDGALSVTRRQAEALARTSVNHYSNAARQEVWKANSDVITGLRWTATLDGRTTLVCQGRDGRVFPRRTVQGPQPTSSADP